MIWDEESVLWALRKTIAFRVSHICHRHKGMRMELGILRGLGVSMCKINCLRHSSGLVSKVGSSAIVGSM